MLLTKLAYRNLRRNRKRTIITLIGIAISVGILVFSMSLLNGLGAQMKKNLIDYQTAHFQVSLPGYDAEKEVAPLDYLMNDAPRTAQIISRIKGVSGVSARLNFPAQLSDGENELPCAGIGIDLAGTDEAVFRIKNTIVAGRYLQAGEEGVLLGDSLANLFQVKVGGMITVSARTKYDAIEAVDLNVVGIFRTGNPLIDKNTFFVPLSLAQTLLEASGEATEIAIRLKPEMAEKLQLLETKIKNTLTEQGIKSEVFDWQYLAADFMQMYTIEKRAFAIVLGLLVIIAAVGITNTMVMVIFERTKEIGTLMALGMWRQQILKLFLWEGLILGIIGSFLGCLWGGLLSWYFKVYGWDLAKLYGNMDLPYPIKDYLYFEVSFVSLFCIFIFGLFISMLASFLPALRASHLKPAEALRSH